jgi:hypothetical protein
MNRLTEIGIKYNTDKATVHNFTEIYDSYFSKFVNPTIVEIGVYNGASIQTYYEYFNKQCFIIGVDNGDQLNYIPKHRGISVLIEDQSFPEELSKKLPNEIDIFIDDGSHFVEHQINTFKSVYSKIRSGGIYIIEDLHACLHPHYNPNGVEDTITFLNKIDKAFYKIKDVTIYSDVPMEEATNTSHITSVIQF